MTSTRARVRLFGPRFGGRGERPSEVHASGLVRRVGISPGIRHPEGARQDSSRAWCLPVEE
jgi:hypothetical protein